VPHCVLLLRGRKERLPCFRESWSSTTPPRCTAWSAPGWRKSRTTSAAPQRRGGETVIREFAPDLILLDIDMPGENGLEFCKRLKDNPATARIPVIFLTASRRDRAEGSPGLELGAVDYVTKPFEPAELKARVRASLRTKRLIDTPVAQARQRCSCAKRSKTARAAA
jgi:DNA-binding response OmpR family regulator